MHNLSTAKQMLEDCLSATLAVARNRFVTVTATQAYSFGSHNSSFNSEAWRHTFNHRGFATTAAVQHSGKDSQPAVPTTCQLIT